MSAQASNDSLDIIHSFVNYFAPVERNLAEGLRTEPHASFAVLREGGVTKSRTSRSTTGVPASTPPRWNCIFKGREVAQSCESHSCMISSCTNSYFFSPSPAAGPPEACSLLTFVSARRTRIIRPSLLFPPASLMIARSRKRGARRNSARESSSRTRVSRRRRAGRPIEHERSPICRLSGRGERRVGNSADRKSVVRSVQEGGREGEGFGRPGGRGQRDLRDDADADANAMRSTCARSRCPTTCHRSRSLSLSLSLSFSFGERKKAPFVRLHLQVQGEVAVVHQPRGRGRVQRQAYKSIREQPMSLP